MRKLGTMKTFEDEILKFSDLIQASNKLKQQIFSFRLNLDAGI